MMRQTERSLRFAGTGTATLLLLSGCMTAKLDEDRAMSTSIGATEAVVLLAKPHVEGITAEDDFMDCVGNKMAKSTGIQVRPNDLFVDSMFPCLMLSLSSASRSRSEVRSAWSFKASSVLTRSTYPVESTPREEHSSGAMVH